MVALQRLSLAAVLLLSACAIDWQKVHRQADQIQAACDEKYSISQTPAKAAALRCATPSILALYEKNDYSFFDLLRRERAGLEKIAEREDAGQLTPIQADAVRAELNFRITSERRERQARGEEAYERAVTDLAIRGTKDAEEEIQRLRRW